MYPSPDQYFFQNRCFLAAGVANKKPNMITPFVGVFSINTAAVVVAVVVVVVVVAIVSFLRKFLKEWGPNDS